MPQPLVDIEVETHEAMEMAQELEGEIPKSADRATRRVAREAMRRLIVELTRQNSIGTGRGVSSIDFERRGQAEFDVLGNKYLQYVDTGTRPHYPDTSNPRFRAWAAKHGIPTFVLARHIAQQGTKAHPFIAEALSQVFDRAEKEFDKEIGRAIAEATA